MNLENLIYEDSLEIEQTFPNLAISLFIKLVQGSKYGEKILSQTNCFPLISNFLSKVQSSVLTFELWDLLRHLFLLCCSKTYAV